MKKKKTTKKTAIIVAIIIVVAILICWGYKSSKNITPDVPGTITLSQGTQARFESLSIGLSSIDNNSAWLSIHKDGDEESTNKQVATSDTISIYGYNIEIKSINKGYSFFNKPGSSQGNVKFIIEKQ
jgi:hypothetical protein